MTPSNFEMLLLNVKAELIAAFKKGAPDDLEVNTKLLIDFTEALGNTILNANKTNTEIVLDRLGLTNTIINNVKGDIMKDNRLRHEVVMTEIKKLTDYIEKKEK